MISNQILQTSSTLSRLSYHRFIPLLTRFGSTQSKVASSSQNKSTKSSSGKSSSEYLADDMYNHTTYSYYDYEVSMMKFRLPQPSSYAPLKPEATPQKK